jgi:hypothetical protein
MLRQLLAGTAAAPAAAKLVGTIGAGSRSRSPRLARRSRGWSKRPYRRVVRDHPGVHDFVFAKSWAGTFERDVTSVASAGTRPLVVKLTAGKYTYYCRLHESSMFGYVAVS